MVIIKDRRRLVLNGFWVLHGQFDILIGSEERQ